MYGSKNSLRTVVEDKCMFHKKAVIVAKYTKQERETGGLEVPPVLPWSSRL